MGHVRGNKRLFLPIRIDFEVNKKRDRVFVGIGDEKKNEARVQISRFHRGNARTSSRTLAKRMAGGPQQPPVDKTSKLHDVERVN